MIRDTQLMDRFYKDGGMVGFHMLVNAVAEIEDMAAALAVAGEDRRHFGADAFRRGVEDGRVHVALQSDLMADALARLAKVGGPVETEGIGTALRHRLQPLPAALCEEDHWHLAPFGFAGEAGDDLAHVAQRELFEIT